MKTRFPVKTISLIKSEKQLFLGVFLVGLLLQFVARSASIGGCDRLMWADEIKFFLNHDPRVFDFHRAYGHPGGTLLELGCLFHVTLGFSYVTALDLGVSILVAASSAASAVFCFLLYRNSKWWLATAAVLLLNHSYLGSTPPTAVEMPFIALIVLSSWWLWEQQSGAIKRTSFFLLGVVIGMAAATRLDAALLVSPPLFLLLLHRHGRKVGLPFLVGAGISFFVSDPFLWFMPRQHIYDLLHKFLIHYTNTREFLLPRVHDPVIWINSTWLAVLSIGWAFYLLRQRRLGEIIPIQLMLVFFCISFVAVTGIISSRFQADRYLFPLIVVWEIFLPLFAIETLASTNSKYVISELANHQKYITDAIILLSFALHLSAYLMLI